MEEVTDEPLYLERVCGINIGKAALEACIRVPSEAGFGRRAQETRSFATTKGECWRWRTGYAVGALPRW